MNRTITLLEDLKCCLNYYGASGASTGVLNIIKKSQESAQTQKFKEGDKNWISVARRVYQTDLVATFNYNGVERDANWDCINWTGNGGVGTSLEAYNDGKPVVPVYKQFSYPSLQYIIDNNPGVIVSACLTKHEYRGYLDAVQDAESNDACPHHSSYSREPTSENRDRVNRVILNEDIECILRKIGMSGHLELFKSMVLRESAMIGQSAESGAGAIGLAQIIDGDEEIERITEGSHTFDVASSGYDNLMIGAVYLKYLLSRFNNDIIKAVAAYNCGVSCINDSIVAASKAGISDYRRVFTRPRDSSIINEETYNYVRALVPSELGL